MAASTITRSTWTDGASGTIINNAALHADVYAKIDQMFAGAGAYATFTFGGLIAAEGFGTHSLSAGGTGSNTFGVRNTSAGTGNLSRVRLGNDSTAELVYIDAFSSTYATSLSARANGARFVGSGAGGITINAFHASGVVHFYTNNTYRGGFNESGHVIFGPNLTDAAANNMSIRVDGAHPYYGRICIHGDGTGYGVSVVRNNGGTITNLLHLVDNGNVIPATDNTGMIGTTSFRFAQGNFVTVNTGDILLENGWAFTESYKIGVEQDGVGLVDDRGRLQAFFAKDGTVYLGEVRDLSELVYSPNTTPQSRSLVMRPGGKAPWA